MKIDHYDIALVTTEGKTYTARVNGAASVETVALAMRAVKDWAENPPKGDEIKIPVGISNPS